MISLTINAILIFSIVVFKVNATTCVGSGVQCASDKTLILCSGNNVTGFHTNIVDDDFFVFAKTFFFTVFFLF